MPKGIPLQNILDMQQFKVWKGEQVTSKKERQEVP